MRMRINYKKYPLSQKLTDKSLNIALLTRPLHGLALGVLPGMICAVLLPNSLTLPLVLMGIGMVGGPVLLRIVRKKMYVKLDAEYEKILQMNK